MMNLHESYGYGTGVDEQGVWLAGLIYSMIHEQLFRALILVLEQLSSETYY